VEKVKLGKEHGVPSWLEEGYRILIDDLSQASLGEMTLLGWETSFRILWARDEIARRSNQNPTGGYWVPTDKLRCGYCWRYNGRQTPISATGMNGYCSYCSQIPANTIGSYGLTFFEMPSSTVPSPAAEDKSKIVSEKVAEVFAEELEEARRRNVVSDD